jgi:hypothetical protein
LVAQGFRHGNHGSARIGIFDRLEGAQQTGRAIGGHQRQQLGVSAILTIAARRWPGINLPTCMSTGNGDFVDIGRAFQLSGGATAIIGRIARVAYRGR